MDSEDRSTMEEATSVTRLGRRRLRRLHRREGRSIMEGTSATRLGRRRLRRLHRREGRGILTCVPTTTGKYCNRFFRARARFSRVCSNLFRRVVAIAHAHTAQEGMMRILED